MTRRSAATAAQAAAKATAAADTLTAWLCAQPGRGERDSAGRRTRPWRPGQTQSGLTLRRWLRRSRPILPMCSYQYMQVPLTGATSAPRCVWPIPIGCIIGCWSAGRRPTWRHSRKPPLAPGPSRGSSTYDRLEEDLFHLLVAGPSRSLSLAGARILAGQLRAAAAGRHALALARVGHSHACPFDLHALVPVPDAILRRGPDDPEALAWLWTHWGTTEMLRHVAEDEATAAVLHGRAALGGRGVGPHLLVGRLDALAGAGGDRRTLAVAAVRHASDLSTRNER